MPISYDTLTMFRRYGSVLFRNKIKPFYWLIVMVTTILTNRSASFRIQETEGNRNVNMVFLWCNFWALIGLLECVNLSYFAQFFSCYTDVSRKFSPIPWKNWACLNCFKTLCDCARECAWIWNCANAFNLGPHYFSIFIVEN